MSLRERWLTPKGKIFGKYHLEGSNYKKNPKIQNNSNVVFHFNFY